MRSRLRPLAVTVLLFLAGCAGRLGQPPAHEASASAGEVEVTALANVWSGWPAELGRLVTPVRVRIANRGDSPVRVDATKFALMLAGGGRLAAMLPGDVHGVVAEPAPAALPHAGAALGPTRERSGPGWALNEPAADPRADPSHEPDRTWPLPSADMLTLALPEGVLPPGREITGFIYFERAPRDAAGGTLTWPVGDTSGETLGVVRVPLRLR